MFIYTMFRARNIKVAKQSIILSLLLLMQSMSLQADTVEEAGALSNVHEANKDIDLESGDQLKVVQASSVRSKLPGWPERQQVDRESKIPPPPPGPYMSTALSVRSIHGASFEKRRVINNTERRAEVKNGSIDRFSPDKPWPNHLRAPSRWKPENGYQFVGDQKKNKTYAPSMNDMYPAGKTGYRSDERMSQPGNWARNHSGGAPAMQSSGSRDSESRQMYPATRSMSSQGERYYAYPPGYRGGVYNNSTNQSPYPVQGKR